MKRIVLLGILCSMAAYSRCQPLVYFDFLSHDEDTGPWNNTSYYTGDRTKLIALATYFQSKGITLNLQSDWLYLTNVISKETPTLMAGTGNKNILRWLHEDKGVELDPHSHEKIYIYPDIVNLMDSLGLPESKLMGGSLYNKMNGINVWTNLINGQNGVIFPNKFWQPDYIMGGGSPNHVADLNYYGFWNPKDTANYLTHWPANHLRHLGVGCDIKVFDTSSVAVIAAKLRDVIQKVQSGQYPASGFYVQTIFFGHGDLNNTAFYNKLLQVADSANAIVASGKAQWKTLKQAYTEWETTYAAQMFQWECGQLSTGLEEDATNAIRMYPNPASDMITVEAKDNISGTSYMVSDLAGRQILTGALDNQNSYVDLRGLEAGLYFIRIGSNTGEVFKVIKK